MSSLRGVFFFDLLSSTNRNIKIRTLFDLLILTTLLLLPLWVGFFWDYVSTDFNFFTAIEKLKKAILNGELLIISIGFSAPVFIFVTKKTPDHRTVNKQLLLYSTYFLSFLTLSAYLGMKSSDTKSDDAIVFSIIIFCLFSFITYISNLAIKNSGGGYNPQDASNDLKTDAESFAHGLDSFGDDNE